MRLFGVRRVGSKDHAQEKVLTPTKASSALLASLFSHSELDEESSNVLHVNADETKPALTVPMEEIGFDCNELKRLSESSGTVTSPRESVDRLSDRIVEGNRDRKASTRSSQNTAVESSINGKGTLSNLARRDSIKRSLSRKMARSESRRQMLNIKDNRTANLGQRRLSANLAVPEDANSVEQCACTVSLESKLAHLSMSPVTPGIYAREEETVTINENGNAKDISVSTVETHQAEQYEPTSESALAITIDTSAFVTSAQNQMTVNLSARTRSKRRPPPLIGTQGNGPDSTADWPSAGLFGSDGGFMTGGFRITAEGMVGKPDLETREDSDPEADEEAPRSEAIVMVRSLKEFRNGPTIGAGAAGRVYIAEHMPSMRTMAIKVVNVYSKEKRNQLLKELETLSTHVSRYLVRFYGAFYDGSGAVHIALEYMDHGCLATFVQRVGAIPERIVQMIGQDCLRGLRFLHRHHVLHRDFKTANILLSRKLCRAKLSDFGLARDLHPGVSKADTFVGTVAYMSPERLQGGKYTYASDIWALGVSLVECLLGRHPFNRPQNYFDYIEATAASGAFQGLDKEMRFSTEAHDFIKMCTHTDPKQRPQAIELLEHPWIKGVRRDVKVFGAWLDDCRIRSIQVASKNMGI